MKAAKLHERLKPGFKIHQPGTYKKRKGLYLIYMKATTPAVGGGKAWRLYFTDRDEGTLEFVGYTHPVNFNDDVHDLPDVSQFGTDGKTFEEEENEIESEWKEMEENARLRRRVFA